MSKVVSFHSADGRILPLAGGSTLHVTSFRDSARVAVTIVGPSGGDGGGFILSSGRARLLASWLLMATDDEEVLPGQRTAGEVRALPVR
jgi:hypothetical protein